MIELEAVESDINWLLTNQPLSTKERVGLNVQLAILQRLDVIAAFLTEPLEPILVEELKSAFTILD